VFRPTRQNWRLPSQEARQATEALASTLRKSHSRCLALSGRIARAPNGHVIFSRYVDCRDNEIEFSLCRRQTGRDGEGRESGTEAAVNPSSVDKYLAGQFRGRIARPLRAFRKHIFDSVLPAFGDLNERANRVAQESYDKAARQATEWDDPASIGEAAAEDAFEWYRSDAPRASGRAARGQGER
jgi:hypothetical protein